MPEDDLAYDVAVSGVEHITDLMPFVPPGKTKRKMVTILYACIETYCELRELAHNVAVSGVEHLVDLMPLVPPEETKQRMVVILYACIETYCELRVTLAHREPSAN